MAWQKDPTTGEHQLPYDTGFYCVYQSAAGDWCAGWQYDKDPCITDETFDYFETWQKARKYCDGLKCHINQA